jgi:hypothetical protein
MVTSMDPDAPRRERLALHDLDAQVKLIASTKLLLLVNLKIFHYFKLLPILNLG